MQQKTDEFQITRRIGIPRDSLAGMPVGRTKTDGAGSRVALATGWGREDPMLVRLVWDLGMLLVSDGCLILLPELLGMEGLSLIGTRRGPPCNEAALPPPSTPDEGRVAFSGSSVTSTRRAPMVRDDAVAEARAGTGLVFRTPLPPPRLRPSGAEEF